MTCLCVSAFTLQPMLDLSAEQRKGGGSTVCFSKQAVSYASLNLPPTCARWLALFPLFVALALVNIPEIHIFTTAKGINNYQSALIQCSA